MLFTEAPSPPLRDGKAESSARLPTLFQRCHNPDKINAFTVDSLTKKLNKFPQNLNDNLRTLKYIQLLPLARQRVQPFPFRGATVRLV